MANRSLLEILLQNCDSPEFASSAVSVGYNGVGNLSSNNPVVVRTSGGNMDGSVGDYAGCGNPMGGYGNESGYNGGSRGDSGKGKGGSKGGNGSGYVNEYRALERRFKEKEHAVVQLRQDAREKTSRIKVCENEGIDNSHLLNEKRQVPLQ